MYACQAWNSEKRKAFIEVKGVTLESDNIARFPDAPTERGVKHLKELIHCMQEGYEAYLLLVIQMKGAANSTEKEVSMLSFGLFS